MSGLAGIVGAALALFLEVLRLWRETAPIRKEAERAKDEQAVRGMVVAGDAGALSERIDQLRTRRRLRPRG